MTEETYLRICELHHDLMDSGCDLAQNFQKHTGLYWELQGELPQEKWQTVNACFINFHKFYMAVLALALNDTP